MLHPELFDKLEYIARVLRRCEEPFGGLQVTGAVVIILTLCSG